MTSVIGSSDGVALLMQYVVQHSFCFPEAAKEKLLGVEAGFGLRQRLFSSREPDGAILVSAAEDPAFFLL